jgi:hypothetical protein
VEFQWFPGMAKSQAQKSIDSLHDAACRQLRVPKVLEISSKSRSADGVALSAFNLMIRTVKYGREFSVECAYQSSKVFEHGGPYTDLRNGTSLDAKRDPRLIESGKLTGPDGHFKFLHPWPGQIPPGQDGEECLSVG